MKKRLFKKRIALQMGLRCGFVDWKINLFYGDFIVLPFFSNAFFLIQNSPKTPTLFLATAMRDFFAVAKGLF